MIFLIGGIPCSGKSTLMRGLISRLGSHKLIEPMPLFKCQEHDDILVCGQYPEGETFGGTDKLSYGAIPKFREFIDFASKKYRHTIVEGDRFFRAEDIEWVVDNYKSSVYILTVDLEEEKRRHISRNDTQTEVWLRGRRSQIDNIRKNINLLGNITIVENNTKVESKKMENAIYELLADDPN